MDSLIMIGMSLRGRLGPGAGPALTYTDPEGLSSAKRSQCDVPALLRAVEEQTEILEPWLWNTCHRFELYGWLPEETPDEPPSDRAGAQARAATQARQLLFESVAELNVLYGAEACHHLLRTAMGLNSGLPGERDVIAQLEAAHRLADGTGTAGPLMRHMLADVLAFESNLRGTTKWGSYAPDYAHAALSRLVQTTGLDLPACRTVVIGGSTTSAGVLRTLTEHFDVPSHRLMLIYRGHRRGGQIKVLRKAIGEGRRMRVQSYTERRVISTIAQADVLVLGVDRDEPVLDAERIRDCRDWVTRPLTIFDFNTFGSTAGMETINGVTLHDASELEAEAVAFADRICASEEFVRAVEAAEAAILERMPASGNRSERAAGGGVARSGRSLAVGGVGSTA